MRLPTFLIAGATRSGTSFLHAALGTHPAVFVTHPKELQHFNRDDRHARGTGAYATAFAGAGAAVHTGESTPMYWESGVRFAADGALVLDPGGPDTMRRIAETLPGVRVILTVREPVARLRSMYRKNYYQGRGLLPSLAAELDAERAGAVRLLGLHRSRYDLHLAGVLRAVPRERVLLLVFEEWIGAPETALRDIARFLGIDPVFDLARAESGRNALENYRPAGAGLPEPDAGGARLAAALRAELRPARDAVEAFLGRSLPWDGSAG